MPPAPCQPGSSSLDKILEDCGSPPETAWEKEDERAFWCPRGRTLTAWDQIDQNLHVFRSSCNTWKCLVCAGRKAARLAYRVEAAFPDKFITLTCRVTRRQTPRQAYDRSRRQVSELAKRIRRNGSEFEYLRLLEETKRGWPHYHLIARSPYIPQAHLSEMWRLLTGHLIVDIRALDDTKEAVWYVTKYVTKQKEVSYTSRRVSWSRRFFTDERDTTVPQPDYCGWRMEDDDPYDLMKRCGDPDRWEMLSRTHWRYNAPTTAPEFAQLDDFTPNPDPPPKGQPDVAAETTQRSPDDPGHVQRAIPFVQSDYR